MRRHAPWILVLAIASFGLLAVPAMAAEAAAQDKKEEKGHHEIKLAEGALTMQVGKVWDKKEPRVRIIEYEFAVPAAEGDEQAGRVTLMGAGGSIEANIDRWFGQFTQPDGKSTEDEAKVEEKTIAGQKVHLVDVSGTFSDRRGPFAPAVKRPGYRMLAAIIETKGRGNYFVKFYGPEKTVKKNEKVFHDMINSLAVKEVKEEK